MEKYVLHGKSLLVVSASDLEYIPLELIPNRISSNFLANLHNQPSPLTLLKGRILSYP